MRPERGNILFLILLAVVLFAALSYAVTSSMRGGGKDGSSESNKSAAAAVTQYMTLVRSEVQRLMLVNGCNTNNLDFRNDVYKRISNGAIDVSSSPVAVKAGCAVFVSQGGSITPQTFEKYAQAGYVDYYTVNNDTVFKPGHFSFRYIKRLNEGTDEAEIVMFTTGIKDEICAAMVNPNDPQLPLAADPHSNEVLSVAPPTFSGPSTMINEPANLYTDIFAIRFSNAGTMPCMAAMTMVPR